MTHEPRKAFNHRAFWSLLLAVTVLGLPWSGVELHAAGHGGWTEATHAWMAVHWVFALLFLIAVVGHLVMNGRALLRYVRGLTARVLPFSREALTALAITAGLVLLAVGHDRLGGVHHPRGAARGSAHAAPERVVSDRAVEER